MSDMCEHGSLPADDPRSFYCDYQGFYPTHWCEGSWGPDVQAELESARSLTELRLVWDLLEQDRRVDTYGGGEWHHAVAHLRYKLGQQKGPCDGDG